MYVRASIHACIASYHRARDIAIREAEKWKRANTASDSGSGYSTPS